MRKPQFPPYFWQELAADNPLGRRDITEQDARDWFDMVWPVYRQHRTRVVNKNHKARVSQFWIRITERDIERARAFGLERRRSAEAARMSEIAERAFPPEPPAPRRDLPPLKIRGAGGGY